MEKKRRNIEEPREKDHPRMNELIKLWARERKLCFFSTKVKPE